jgi:uncharacterized phosphosugar-binding protein
MLAHKYADAVHEVVQKIEVTQMANIVRAAEAVAGSLARGGAFWVHSLGHGGERELTGRAGGLMATRVFSFGFHVDSPIADCLRDRPRPESVGTASDLDLEAIRLAVRSSEMRPGDVLMLASVSGRNREPIELALAARSIGVTVIGLTSLAYTAQVQSAHPSGKRLYEVADIVIDNCAPYGDACIELLDPPHKALPISGIAHTTIGWMICGEVIEKLQTLGKPAHVYMSQNRPDGREYNERALREYNQVGY